MPLIDGKLVTADEALSQGRCPECAVDLTKVNPIAERRSHWKTYPTPNRQGLEALRRMALLDDFIAKNNVRTSNMPKTAAAAPAPLP